MVRVLALDTATPYLVLGLPHAERALRLERRHAEVLWAELEQFLEEAQTPLESLQGIAVGRGPGSYTGLRVGIAAGLGLGRGRALPVVGVDTLAGVALRYQGTVTVAHQARGEWVYAAVYRLRGQQAIPVAPPGRVRRAELEPQGLLVLDEPPSGRALAQLGVARLQSGARGVEPLYL
ncbi:tRNA threonylcarbamoyladenosine biosynthesis protein TsaB [Meiothermus luteus]|jgi:tRNA threonylcarbamoyl adenosine modification protein YeaZ|uniref:tRNA threonylcarbamoyladenosine biosynthesis protein TsaB n=1 Tax=Meiothermus luteus TaxID=2026184 RepID=A0A399EZC4_9DEIN|nr:tRNA (adenosine(37)-N6)-threonylcarbamoyltransferase complex dimerization subunit type 1 TsaB [Meiothermus luteus]RIH88379.1 tRNA threonylcarbamoyladenosine biosynthesis protein TsaB [Meiothermus luteus]RMH56493.1 MAG: tRNA (adenosine(37)-N6)-threonylcarbamoyltransferase complex dimerization subunit type 1 TsaB [Deinococcota bacterium]